MAQPWTLDGASVRLSAATGGLARHLADLAASTLTVAPVTVAGVDGYRVEATDGTHVLWPSAVSSSVWVTSTIPTNDRVDDVIGSVVQQPTGLVIGGPLALAAVEQSALRGWRTTAVDGETPRPSRPVGRPLAEFVDRYEPSGPVVIDALTFATVGEILTATRDLRTTRRVVLVTADETSIPAAEFNDVLRRQQHRRRTS